MFLCVCIYVCLCAPAIVTDPYGPRDLSTLEKKKNVHRQCTSVCTCRTTRVIFMTEDYPEDTRRVQRSLRCLFLSVSERIINQHLTAGL